MDKQEYSHPAPDFLRSIDIHTLLPQQEPFVMVGMLVGYTDDTTTTETRIAEGNLLVDNRVLTTAGMMENMAQTCAARIGYTNKYILRQGVQIGVIGSVKNLVINAHPHVGDTITTRVSIVQELMGVTLATAETLLGDKTLATAQIKLAVRDKDREDGNA